MRSRFTGILAILLFSAAAHAAERPLFRATRASKPPVIDGDLSDPAWQGAQEISGFIQHDPDDGKPATQKTVVKVVYDGDAIYVGALMEDTHRVTTLLGRRDSDLESDWFRISIDSQHDRLTGAAFWVNPSNVQVDMILYNDIYDDWSWDAVWASAAKIVSNGWIAEVRVPFSQLRFPDKAQQTWGVNFARRTVSNKELARLVNTPKMETGTVSRFADLEGLDGIHPERAFEIVPYGVSRSDLTSRTETLDPFGRHAGYRADGGVDLKYGITSSVTLTATLNPDFGQVEVDPAVLNLSQFETFFPEKRPFFTEGAQMFRFGQGPANSRWNFNLFPPNFFYSRRIGRAPQASVGYDYGDQPGETTILGAAKITGKVGKGWSVGVLDALTDRERGEFVSYSRDDDGKLQADRWSQTVEPMTNYLVARAAKEYGKNSRIGFMLTSTNRRLPSELSYLRSSAYVAGIDGYTFLKDKNWLWEWYAGSSLVEGSKEAIQSTQNSPLRYYDRPDADYLKLDANRTSLTGLGARMMLGKQTGKWRPNLQIQTYSPGFELNDVGFMTRADIVNAHAVIRYGDETVGKRTRERGFWVGKYDNWNYGGDRFGNGVHSNGYFVLKNYWEVYGWAGGSAQRLDDRRTRGGPLVTMPSEYVAGGGFSTDSRKKFSASAEGEYSADDWGGDYSGVFLRFNYRPTTALRFTLSPSYSHMNETTQYVTTIVDSAASATYGKRYIFSGLDQRTLDLGIRAEWTASAKLSFQLYAQPFIASGGYHDFKELARPRSGEYTPLHNLAFRAATNSYESDGAVAFGNPDFNFRSVRGSAVVRWEFRPGSALYVVWNENREDVVPIGNFRLRRDFAALPDALSKDVFLVKISYWLPL